MVSAVVDDPDELVTRLVSLIAVSSHRLRLYSPDLHPWLWQQDQLVQAISSFLSSNAKHHLDLVVSDPDQLLHRGHHLIPVLQALSSRVKVWALSKEAMSQLRHQADYLLMDDSAYFLENQRSPFRVLCDSDRVRVRQLEQHWQSMLHYCVEYRAWRVLAQ